MTYIEDAIKYVPLCICCEVACGALCIQGPSQNVSDSLNVPLCIRRNTWGCNWYRDVKPTSNRRQNRAVLGLTLGGSDPGLILSSCWPWLTWKHALAYISQSVLPRTGLLYPIFYHLTFFKKLKNRFFSHTIHHDHSLPFLLFLISPPTPFP